MNNPLPDKTVLIIIISLIIVIFGIIFAFQNSLPGFEESIQWREPISSLGSIHINL